MKKAPAPITRDLELEALQEAVRWPNAAPRTIIVLAGRLLATRRDQDGYAYFRERAEACPDQPLLLALEGMFQARLARQVSAIRRLPWIGDAIAKLDRAVSREPGLATYFRGLVLAELPPILRKAEAAAADLEWVLANKERFPTGLRRNAYRALARAYAALGRDKAAREALDRSGYSAFDDDAPSFITDSWLTAEDGVHFGPPGLVELAPGVHVAQGYDFADFAFVVTDDGVVAIDTGTVESHARAALDAFRQVSRQPIRYVILTHAHWDHIGGLGALAESGTEVLAQANFADELRIVNESGVPFRYFFGAAGKQRYDVVPDRLVGERETLNLGGLEFVLYPVRGGETDDGLLIHLPSRGVVFTGDVMMPYVGAPFLPEGSPEGLLETMQLIRSLEPQLLVHGHTPLTEQFTIEALPGIEAALRDVHELVLRDIREGKTLVETLHQNLLPESLRSHPRSVVPFLIMRDHFVKRLYHRRTGYWKPDGDGMEDFTAGQWAAALDLLGGRRERAFISAAETLLGQGDSALAFRLVELGLARYPASRRLGELRRRALDRLREQHQQLNPFKFVVYSEWAGAELQPVQ